MRGSLLGKRNFVRPSHRENDNIKVNLKLMHLRMWSGLSGPMTGVCEHGNEPYKYI